MSCCNLNHLHDDTNNPRKITPVMETDPIVNQCVNAFSISLLYVEDGIRVGRYTSHFKQSTELIPFTREF